MDLPAALTLSKHRISENSDGMRFPSFSGFSGSPQGVLRNGEFCVRLSESAIFGIMPLITNGLG